MNKYDVTTMNAIVGPLSVCDAAYLYLTAPEKLSHDVRTILGHVYRDYTFDTKDSGEQAPAFADYALSKWQTGVFPTGVLD